MNGPFQNKKEKYNHLQVNKKNFLYDCQIKKKIKVETTNYWEVKDSERNCILIFLDTAKIVLRKYGDFVGCPVAKSLRSQCSGLGFDSWLRKQIPHATTKHSQINKIY